MPNREAVELLETFLSHDALQYAELLEMRGESERMGRMRLSCWFKVNPPPPSLSLRRCWRGTARRVQGDGYHGGRRGKGLSELSYAPFDGAGYHGDSDHDSYVSAASNYG